MKVVRLVIFSVALAAEILFVAALNFFDDWTLEPMPVFFVAAAFLSGMAYLVCRPVFKNKISQCKQPLQVAHPAVIAGVSQLPLRPRDDLCRRHRHGSLHHGSLNP